MSAPGVDSDRVAEIVRRVAAEEIVPSFRRLDADAVSPKSTPGDPHDVVTRVDLAVERRLARELGALLPGSKIVGEEAVAADAALLDALSADGPVWLVDPLDGTRNFVAGIPDFGVMVALCVGGATRIGCIHMPMTGVTFVAEAGAGAWVDGKRVNVTTSRLPSPSAQLIGTVYSRFMPPDAGRAVEERARRTVDVLPALGCAAAEYTALVLGRKDFVLYHRLLPWDHAAGALLLTEAGGAARLLDGRQYGVRNVEAGCLLVGDASSWSKTRALLLDDLLGPLQGDGTLA